VFDVLVCISVLVLAHGVTGLKLLGNGTFFSLKQYLAGFCLATYTALLLGKMCSIAIATPLNADGFWSHTTFLIVLGTCIPIYILLRWTLDRPNASGGLVYSEGPNPWQLCVEHLFLVINLVDTFAVLHFLPRKEHPEHVDDHPFVVLTIIIVCIAHAVSVAVYFSPVVLYAQLHLRTYVSRAYVFFIQHGQFIFVDGLLLSLRLTVWFWQNWLVTAFIIKNVIFLFLGVAYEKAWRLGSAAAVERNLRAADYHIVQLNGEVQRLRRDLYRQTNAADLYMVRQPDFLPQTQTLEMPTHYRMAAMPAGGVNSTVAYVHQAYMDGSAYAEAGPSDEQAVPGTPLIIRTTAPPPGVYPLQHTPNSPKSA
jgi:hypothetical protein